MQREVWRVVFCSSDCVALVHSDGGGYSIVETNTPWDPPMNKPARAGEGGVHDEYVA
jgi:hypothetical protein